MVDTQADLAAALEQLRAEVQAISKRLTALESAPATSVAAPPAAVAPKSNGAAVVREAAPQPPAEEISEETMLVIAAAVAAFLGERAHIKQVRLIRSPMWASQGRVSIQASHHLHHRSSQ